MQAYEVYLSALNGWKLPAPKPRPKTLAGGCLLYRLPTKGAEPWRRKNTPDNGGKRSDHS